MAKFVFLLVCVLVAAVSGAVTEDDGDNGPLSNFCILCLCEVLGCPREPECIDEPCGPFQVTRSYWAAAFKVAASNQDMEPYRKCQMNMRCATRTVQHYMDINLRRCENQTPRTDSFRTSCESAAILHVYGPSACASTSLAMMPLRNQLLACLDRRAGEWLPAPESSDTTPLIGSIEDFLV